MQAFDSTRKLRNGKRYNAAKSKTMSKNSRSEGSLAVDSLEINENESPKIRTLTQEVNEQIKSFVAALTRRLKDLTQLVQGMSIASHPNHYPRADTNASYSAHGYPPDWVTSSTDYHSYIRYNPVTKLNFVKSYVFSLVLEK